jgi:hypothetical protein
MPLQHHEYRVGAQGIYELQSPGTINGKGAQRFGFDEKSFSCSGENPFQKK